MKLSTTIQLINLLLALGLLSGCSVKELFSSKQHEMVLIPAGEFMMGDLSCKNTRSTCESKNDEEAYQQCIAEGCVGSPVDRPKHYRRVQQSFLMSKTEITQSQYASLTKRWPSYHDETRVGEPIDDYPVDSVTWMDALRFANLLSEHEGYTLCYSFDETVTLNDKCTGYRLPTVVEWEYAAKAASKYRYAGGNEVKDVAWIRPTSDGRTSKVGLKAPNAWGLYDMTGNVAEWVWDRFDLFAYESTKWSRRPSDYLPKARGTRGGSIESNIEGAKIWHRRGFGPEVSRHKVGFRLVRSSREEPKND